MQIDQGGLSLPNRDYYLKNDSASEKVRDAFKDMIVKVVKLLITDSENIGHVCVRFIFCNSIDFNNVVCPIDSEIERRCHKTTSRGYFAIRNRIGKYHYTEFGKK